MKKSKKQKLYGNNGKKEWKNFLKKVVDKGENLMYNTQAFLMRHTKPGQRNAKQDLEKITAQRSKNGLMR